MADLASLFTPDSCLNHGGVSLSGDKGGNLAD
jgi:hypothetical protein